MACMILQTGFVNSLAFAKSGKFLIAGVGQVCDPLFVLSFFSMFVLFCVLILISKLIVFCEIDMAGNAIWKMGLLKICTKWCRNTSLKAGISNFIWIKEALLEYCWLAKKPKVTSQVI